MLFYKTLCTLKPLKTSDIHVAKGPFTVSLATRKDLKALYRLRFDCFYKEYLNLPDSVVGYDVNRYDIFADNLILKDGSSVVGTYRILSGEKPKDFSFSETFEVKNFKSIPGPVMELSRACIAPSYRNSPIPILLLWRGLSAYLKSQGVKTLVGRVSMAGDDPAIARAVMSHLREQNFIRTDIEARARKPLGDGPQVEYSQEMMPPILRSYLRLGAQVAADTCFDPILKCFDIFTILDVNALPSKFT